MPINPSTRPSIIEIFDSLNQHCVNLVNLKPDIDLGRLASSAPSPRVDRANEELLGAISNSCGGRVNYNLTGPLRPKRSQTGGMIGNIFGINIFGI